MPVRDARTVARVLLRVLVVGTVALIAAQCGDRRSPTAPPSIVASKGAPVVQAISLDRQNVSAGEHVTAIAHVDDPDAQGGLRYEWSVTPTSGSLDGTGATSRWRSPANEPVPGTYMLTVTVIKPYIGTDGAGRPANLEYRVTASSAPITVNDAEREMRATSEAFIADLMNANVAPEMCARNFSDACNGKQTALRDIAANRAAYSGATVSYQFREFQLANAPGACMGSDGTARCATTTYQVEWVRTRTSDGVKERLAGIEFFQGVYDRNRWWLCSARFIPE